MFEAHYDCPCLNTCPLHLAMRVIGGKWKVQTLCALSVGGPLRFGALRRRLGQVSDTVLSSVLRELAQDGMVDRREYLEVPVRVEYAATARALQLMPVLEKLSCWAEENLMRDTQ